MGNLKVKYRKPDQQLSQQESQSKKRKDEIDYKKYGLYILSFGVIFTGCYFLQRKFNIIKEISLIPEGVCLSIKNNTKLLPKLLLQNVYDGFFFFKRRLH